MNDNWPAEKRATDLRNKLSKLKAERTKAVALERSNGRPKRQRLTPGQRKRVLAKTDGRCHICGGEVDVGWQADHVRAHGRGGSHAEENYLAAHALCNNYRWHYLPEEFQFIMKIGIWAKTQVEKGTVVGDDIAAGFERHERNRKKRTRKPD